MWWKTSSSKMPFDPQIYGSAVAAILALGESGQRLMPLAEDRCISPEARDLIRHAGAGGLFPHARSPEAALAGLYFYFGCWDEAHSVAQDIASRDGSYWH